MANELYVYTTPAEAGVELTLDSGAVLEGAGPITANGRSDAHCCQVPDGTAGQGAALVVVCEGYQPFGPHRGLVIPSETGEAKFQLDNVVLSAAAVAPAPGPEPPPVAATDPWGIISEVYATGDYDLSTHDGCGQFTEACCTQLHERNNVMWGHFKKNPGQNQYNGHAVDAVQCLAGEFEGGWDIIHDSVSSMAQPAFNRVGPSDPAIWYYPIDDEAQLELRVLPADRPKPKPTPYAKRR